MESVITAKHKSDNQGMAVPHNFTTWQEDENSNVFKSVHTWDRDRYQGEVLCMQ